MFRGYQVFWNRLFQLIDAAIVVVSFLLSWFIKFHSGLLKHGGHLSFDHYLPEIVLAIPLFLVSNWIAGVYKPMRMRTFWQETITITRSVVIGLLMFMSFLFVIHASEFSRQVLILYAIVFPLLTFISHLGIRHTLRIMRSKGMNRKFVLVVGATNATVRFIDSLESHPWFGYHVIGALYNLDRSIAPNPTPRLGSIDDLESTLAKELIDHVVISLPKSEEIYVQSIVATCEEFGIQSLIIPDYFDILPANPRFESFAGMPLIDTRYVPLDDAVNATLKRAFDIAFSAFVLILLSPLYACIHICVKLSSPGPVIFKQVRVGKNRRLFIMYKFRTMEYQREISTDDDTEWTVANDPRRTRFGTFLRKTSLDELPQFWNVFRGDMSVIGPRPERPQFVECFKDSIPKYMVKHRVRPGITGWAQVNGWRGDTSIAERIKCDIDYIENWTLTMDFRIIAKTLRDGIHHENAY